MRNKTLRLALVVATLAVITLCIISGTLAKYVAQVTASDSARVALFDYTITGLDESQHTINIFDTTSDTGIIGDQTSEKLIAPGTNGNFTVTLANNGETAIKAGFTLTETNASNVPVVYSYGGNYYSSVLSTGNTVRLHDGDASPVTITGNLSALATAIGGDTELTTVGDSTSITVGWAWAFEGVTGVQTDITDTTLGTAGTATVTLQVDCAVEQLDTVTP